MAQEIYVGSIISYDSESGDYHVRLRGSSLDTKTGYPARLLNPIPWEDGGGVKAAPEIPRDSQCLVLKDGYRCYILGFLQPHGIVAGGDAKPTRPVSEGEMFITHKTRSKIGFSNLGTIVLQAQRWAQAALNPITQQLTAFFKNIRINLWSAFVEYFYDSEKEGGVLKFVLTKYPKSTLPNPAGHDTMTTPDRIILKAGALDEEHLIELEIEQKFIGPSDESEFKATTKLGLQDGKYIEHKSTRGITGTTTDLLFEATDESTLHLNLSKTSAQKEIDIIYDVNTEDALVMKVNTDKAIITVKHTGDVTIKTTDGAFINLGGNEKIQPVVLKNWIDQIFKNHVHLNGNQGAPTGTIIGPAVIDVGVDSKTGHFTTTTLAE